MRCKSERGAREKEKDGRRERGEGKERDVRRERGNGGIVVKEGERELEDISINQISVRIAV